MTWGQASGKTSQVQSSSLTFTSSSGGPVAIPVVSSQQMPSGHFALIVGGDANRGPVSWAGDTVALASAIAKLIPKLSRIVKLLRQGIEELVAAHQAGPVVVYSAVPGAGATWVRDAWEPVDDELLALVREHYPGVPIFEDPEAMQEAFPTSDLSAFLEEASDAEPAGE